MKACLDTHAVLWSLAGDARLGSRAREIIVAAKKSDLTISDIVLLEVTMLASKGRLQLSCPPLRLLSRIAEKFRVIPISPDIAALAVSLELSHGDPFDRIIVATALVEKVPLLTRDRLIADSGQVETVW